MCLETLIHALPTFDMENFNNAPIDGAEKIGSGAERIAWKIGKYVVKRSNGREFYYKDMTPEIFWAMHQINFKFPDIHIVTTKGWTIQTYYPIDVERTEDLYERCRIMQSFDYEDTAPYNLRRDSNDPNMFVMIDW